MKFEPVEVVLEKSPGQAAQSSPGEGSQHLSPAEGEKDPYQGNYYLEAEDRKGDPKVFLKEKVLQSSSDKGDF